jgi:sec-independent protein translocase protein TatC
MPLKENDRADLVEHLEELRQRIIRSAIYIAVLTTAAWFFYNPILNALLKPVRASLGHGGRMVFTGPLEAFWTCFQVSVIVGLVAGAPVLLWEAWGFVSPGLTPRERRVVLPLLPISAVLALSGVALCYGLSYAFFRWMMSYAPPHVEPYLRLNELVIFTAKMYLAFAVCFQLPIVLVGLVRTGVLSSDTLSKRWREAFVVILIVAAIVTPTWDAFTMVMLAVPLLLLYFVTLWAMRVMERRQRKEAESYDEDLESQD